MITTPQAGGRLISDRQRLDAAATEYADCDWSQFPALERSPSVTTEIQHSETETTDDEATVTETSDTITRPDGSESEQSTTVREPAEDPEAA